MREFFEKDFFEMVVELLNKPLGQWTMLYSLKLILFIGIFLVLSLALISVLWIIFYSWWGK